MLIVQVNFEIFVILAFQLQWLGSSSVGNTRAALTVVWYLLSILATVNRTVNCP